MEYGFCDIDSPENFVLFLSIESCGTTGRIQAIHLDTMKTRHFSGCKTKQLRPALENLHYFATTSLFG